MRSFKKVILVVITALVFAGEGFAGIGRKPLPGQYEDQVQALFSQHRWTQGKRILDEALKAYPSQAGLHYLAGRYWYNERNYDRARYHLVKACQISYNHTDAKTLLVTVEEITGNYSSAVCYVNELLEVNPYWKGLWLRKVELYKKMDNYAEANAILERLAQIYPNDASIDSDRFQVLESTYTQSKKSGDVVLSEEALRQMLSINPYDPDYQIAYANLLIQSGRYNEALDQLSGAVNYNPGNVSIIRKTTDILMETGRSMGALALVRSQMAAYPSPELSQLYSRLLETSARMESEQDAYQLYSRVYERTHTMESLSFLLKESVRRGYSDEALYYIAESRKKNGDTPALAALEYRVLRDKGENEMARAVLERSFKAFPSSYDINVNYSRVVLSEAAAQMASGDYSSAAELLEPVACGAVEKDLRLAAYRRLYTCCTQTNDYQRAEEVLKERLSLGEPEYRLSIEYASLLKKQGRPQDALETLWDSINENAGDPVASKLLKYSFEETAISLIRSDMQEQNYPRALEVCSSLLAVNPSSYDALRYMTNLSPNPERYIEAGLEYYPSDMFFREKKNLVQSASYAALSDSLSRKGDIAEAAASLDRALALNPLDEDLKYRRGLLWEKQHQYDSALVYQSVYKPSIAEEDQFKAHLKALGNRAYHSSVALSTDWIRLPSMDRLIGFAALEYSGHYGKETFGAKFSYSGRDAVWDNVSMGYVFNGGRGVQLQASYSHEFSSWLSLGLSGGISNQFFPLYSASLDAQLRLPGDWEMDPSLQMKIMDDGKDIFAGSLSLSKELDNFYLGGKVSGGWFGGLGFVSGLLRGRFYPFSGGRDYLEFQGGAGTAPEIYFYELYYELQYFNQLNTFVSISGNHLITPNMSAGASLSWNTLYTGGSSVRYITMLVANVQFTVYF